MLSLSFFLQQDTSSFFCEDALEQSYKKYYKKIISFLYANPLLCCSICLNGVQTEYFSKKHPELFDVLAMLEKRGQVEMIGGGYYSPIMPLLLQKDRNAQIEKLTTLMKQKTGARPRGASIYCSAWSSSLIPGLLTCGMRYVFLDASLLPEQKKDFLPLVSYEAEKTIYILPLYEGIATYGAIDKDSFLDDLQFFVETKIKNSKTLKYGLDRCIVLPLDVVQFKEAMENGFWQQVLCSYKKMQENGASSLKVKITLPKTLISEAKYFLPSFFPSSLDKDIAKWGAKPYTQVKMQNALFPTAKDFLETYPQSKSLMTRLSYIRFLQEQCCDRVQREAIANSLMQCFYGPLFLCSKDGAFASFKQRRKIYRLSCQIEAKIREQSFSRSLTSFDYDKDGLQEYVCMQDAFDACVSKKGGCIFSLNVLPFAGEYCDNQTRLLPFEDFLDDYTRGLFVCHLFTKKEFYDYSTQGHKAKGLFCDSLYEQLDFSPQRCEIRLEATGLFGKKKQQVRIRKQFIFGSNNIQVQLIIKNESDSELKAKLALESNFATLIEEEKPQKKTTSLSFEKQMYKIEVPIAGELRTLGKEGANIPCCNALRMTDTFDKTCFVFEPNEMATLSCFPLFFERKDMSGQILLQKECTTVATFAWDVNLPCGGETEKTLILSIAQEKKNKPI